MLQMVHERTISINKLEKFKKVSIITIASLANREREGQATEPKRIQITAFCNAGFERPDSAVHSMNTSA